METATKEKKAYNPAATEMAISAIRDWIESMRYFGHTEAQIDVALVAAKMETE